MCAGRRCRSPWQTSHEPPPTSAGESLPLKTRESITVTRSESYSVSVGGGEGSNTHIFPGRRCFVCTSAGAAPCRGAAAQSSGSDWAGSCPDTALWPEQRKVLGCDGKSQSQIWPPRRASCTAAGCHRDRCLGTCEEDP